MEYLYSHTEFQQTQLKHAESIKDGIAAFKNGQKNLETKFNQMKVNSAGYLALSGLRVEEAATTAKAPRGEEFVMVASPNN